MLAHAGGDDRVAVLGQAVQLADGVLGQDAVEVGIVAERLVALPHGHLAPPLGGVARLHDCGKLLQEILQVADDRQVGLLDLVDFGRIDVDVDDLGAAGELGDLAGHPIVEANAERQQQVGVIDRVVGVDAAVHPEHVQRKRIVAGKTAQAVQRGRHGDLEFSGERGQFLGGLGDDDAAARVDHRPLGPLQEFRHRGDFVGRGAAFDRQIAGQLHRNVVVRHRLHVLNVLRNIDQHRARPTARGHMERLAHDPGDVVHVGHQRMVLGDAAAYFDDRRLLKGVGADHGRADLAGQRQHRHAVELGVGDGGDQVRGAGAAGGHADADLSGRAGVSLGREAAPLLVSGQDHANAIAEAGQGLVQRDYRPPRIGENRVHPVVHKALDDDIRPGRKLGAGSLIRGRSWTIHIIPLATLIPLQTIKHRAFLRAIQGVGRRREPTATLLI